jgi:hypothetical protein
VSVIGYGSQVGPAFGGKLVGRSLWPISEVGNFPMRVEDRVRKVPDGAGGLVEERIKMPIWFDPVHANGTPMLEAFDLAERVLASGWMTSHPDSYPPIVINITDGEANANPSEAAERIKRLATSNGNVLLFNVHLSARQAAKVEFPSTPASLPDEFSRLLFSMSSEMPPPILNEARRAGFNVSPGARGFTFQADMVSLITFLDIGTKRDDNLR